MSGTDRDEPIVLGIGAGHDASVAVLRGGRILSHVLKERITRRRHDWGVGETLIRRALQDAAVTLDEVDYCALSGTQTMPLVMTEGFVDYAPRQDGPLWGWRPHDPASDYLHLTATGSGAEPADALTLDRAREQDCRSPDRAWAELFLEHCATLRGLPSSGFPRWQIDRYLSPLYGPARWGVPLALDHLPETAAATWRENEDHTGGMHRPISVRLGDCWVPGAFIAHHACHAASSYYSSPFEHAFVFTGDGGPGIEAGFLFLGSDGRVRPLAPHYLECGKLFDHVGHMIGLSHVGAAGKLMALASYGTRSLHDRTMVGSTLDWERAVAGFEGATTHDKLLGAWLARSGCGPLSRDPMSPPAPDLARTTQALLEETVFSAIAGTAGRLRAEGAPVEHLCLSGGVALNCPVNSRLWRDARFAGVHAEPHCEDGGLSLGAGWWLQHNLLGTARTGRAAQRSAYAMRGPTHQAWEENELLRQQGDVVSWTRATAADIAADLAADRIVAIHEGRSESGPRALGHRSILADPRPARNWARVNALKGREFWRPFAPVVREDRFAEYFADGPCPSPFMQFTHTVKQVDLMPAVVHVDRTSRVQTVGPDDGTLHDILLAFEDLTGLGVLLNTSFNGPGDPIIEHAREALAFLSTRPGLDVLYLNGRRIVRRTDLGRGTLPHPALRSVNPTQSASNPETTTAPARTLSHADSAPAD